MAAKRSSGKQLLASVDGVLRRRDIAAAKVVAALAVLLVPAGLTPKRFGELAKQAFVEFAASTARLRNGKINHSKVAVLTGLPRIEVKKLLKQEIGGRDERISLSAPVEKIIAAWLSHPRFRGASGLPLRLPIEGASASFAELVRNYGGDVTHRSVLDELQRLGAVQLARSGRKVTLILGNKCRWSRINAQLSALAPTVVDAIQIATDTSLIGKPPAIKRLRLYARDPLELSMIRERVGPAVHTLVTGLTESLKKPNGDLVKNAAYELTLNVLISDGPRRRSNHQKARTRKRQNVTRAALRNPQRGMTK